MNKRPWSSAPGGSWRHVGLAVLMAACWLAIAGRAVAQSADEVGAAFLFNFSKFVEWPANTFADAGAPITIGFVGKASLAETFEKNAKGKNANGRELVVKRLDAGAGAESCQIVFIGEASQVAAVLGAVKGKPVLTVGEGEAYLSAGGMIALSRDGSRLVIDVNGGILKASGLKPDPKLEKAARSVKPG